MNDLSDNSIVNGNILNYNSFSKKNIFVEAYHAIGLPPLAAYYYLGCSKLDPSGKFEITFPTEAYGVISSWIRPNIELRINDSHQILFKNNVRLFVTQNGRNEFKDLEIPSNYIYSDQLSHTSWPEMIKNGIEDISHLPIAEIKEKLAEFLTPIEASPYATEGKQRAVDYRGVIVPKQPKTENHEESVPWNPNWP